MLRRPFSLFPLPFPSPPPFSPHSLLCLPSFLLFHFLRSPLPLSFSIRSLSGPGSLFPDSQLLNQVNRRPAPAPLATRVSTVGARPAPLGFLDGHPTGSNVIKVTSPVGLFAGINGGMPTLIPGGRPARTAPRARPRPPIRPSKRMAAFESEVKPPQPTAPGFGGSGNRTAKSPDTDSVPSAYFSTGALRRPRVLSKRFRQTGHHVGARRKRGRGGAALRSAQGGNNAG